MLIPFFYVTLILQLMCLIGEGFDLSSDEVCGAVVQNRSKGDKIAIWTGDSTRSDDIMHIGYAPCWCYYVHLM